MIALKHNISVSELQKKIKITIISFFKKREKKRKIGLDNKVLASWNGLMCKALTEAYLVFEEETFKALALKNANYLVKAITTKMVADYYALLIQILRYQGFRRLCFCD